jgi:hypothetical protein
VVEKQQAVTAAGGEFKFLQREQMLEGPEMALCWQAVVLNGSRKEPEVQPDQVVWVDPQTNAAVLREFQAGNTVDDVWLELTGQSSDSGLWGSLRRARDSQHKACTVLLPVHSLAPQHWTLLVLCRPASSNECSPAAFSVQYFDPLTQPSPAALEQAKASLRLLAMLIKPAQLMAQPAELQVAASRKQSDGWSCGFWVMLWCEQYYRLARGEAPRLCKATWPERLLAQNNFLQSLMVFKNKDSLKDQKKTNPPLQPALPPPPNVQPELAHGPGKLLQDQLKFGCPTCRHSLRGCHHCNPHKADRYFERKARKDEAALCWAAAKP